ncbi:protein of unknown function [Aminobacter niigataensis]|nr:protein of unknown function [Aminobacter niigataensis]
MAEADVVSRRRFAGKSAERSEAERVYFASVRLSLAIAAKSLLNETEPKQMQWMLAACRSHCVRASR